MEEQGYKLKKNVLFQDNTSAIKLEKNGRNSCTGNSRHVHIRYFFVKGRVDKGELSIECCPTHSMLADYFTKPLQGALFRKLRAVIMGWEHVSISSNDSAHDPDQERVENITEYGSGRDVTILDKVKIYADAVRHNISTDENPQTGTE